MHDIVRRIGNHLIVMPYIMFSISYKLETKINSDSLAHHYECVHTQVTANLVVSYRTFHQGAFHIHNSHQFIYFIKSLTRHCYAENVVDHNSNVR